MLDVLLDTGSVVGQEFRRRHLPSTPILPVSDFLGEGGAVFRTVNNTILPVSGDVVIGFALKEGTFQVPFLVTSTEIGHLILDFSVMGHLVVNGRRDVDSGIDVGNLSEWRI